LNKNVRCNLLELTARWCICISNR